MDDLQKLAEQVRGEVEWLRNPAQTDPAWLRQRLTLTADLLESIPRLAMQYAAEEVAKKIEAELDHAAINELRLPPLFGQQLGEPAVRVSAIEAAVFWIRERFKKL